MRVISLMENVMVKEHFAIKAVIFMKALGKRAKWMVRDIISLPMVIHTMANG